MGHILAPVSAGELIDKISILRIKSERMSDPDKLANVRKELTLLEKTLSSLDIDDPQKLETLMADLKDVNEEIWDAEDIVRAHERSDDFGPDYIATSRRTYRNNDRRASLKRQINVLLKSTLVEEKSHAAKDLPKARRAG